MKGKGFYILINGKPKRISKIKLFKVINEYVRKAGGRKS